MMNSDQRVHKTWGDELRVSTVKQRDIPAIASSPAESETQIFDTLDKERSKFTDGIKKFVQKSTKKKNLLFVDRQDNTPLEAVLKRNGETIDPPKTIQQVGIQDGDVIQLHVKPGDKEKITPYKQRLLIEYNEMLNLKNRSNGMIDFRVGNNYQSYTILITGVKTLVGIKRENVVESDHHVFVIDLPPEYPLRSPLIKFKKPIFHPNVYIDGTVAIAEWQVHARLSEIVIDMINMMTFDIVNPHSPANSYANEWYKQNIKNIKNIIKIPPSIVALKKEVLEFYE